MAEKSGLIMSDLDTSSAGEEIADSELSEQKLSAGCTGATMQSKKSMDDCSKDEEMRLLGKGLGSAPELMRNDSQASGHSSSETLDTVNPL